MTKTGRPLDRSNIWRDMKSSVRAPGVEPGKVFPHNLRYLFARTFYSLERPLPAGGHPGPFQHCHYTHLHRRGGLAHARQVERMGLVIT